MLRHELFLPFSWTMFWSSEAILSNEKAMNRITIDLRQSIIWVVSGLLAVFHIFAPNLARGLPVARHWMVLLQWKVE